MKKISSIIFFFMMAISADAQNNPEVLINNEPLAPEEINFLEQTYRVKVQKGNYWYDRISGAWGVAGGSPLGLIMPGLKMGGELQADASNGTTGIFINNREITSLEKSQIESLTGYPAIPGRYWMDGYGNIGLEYWPALVNLYQLARQKSNYNGSYRGNYTGIGSGGDGETFYVIGKDFSYIR